MQLVFDQQEEDYGSQNDEYPQNVSQEDSSNCDEYDEQDYVEVDAEINIDELQGKLALVQNYEDNAAWQKWIMS